MNKTGRDNPGVIAPPPLFPLAALVLGVALDWLFPLRILADGLSLSARLAIGGALAGCGIVLVVVAGHIFSKAATNIQPQKPALHLATGGIYEWMRNPMYVGFVPITAGLAVALASDWTFVLMVPAFVLIHYGVVLREERYLEAKFGEDYRRYKARVPRYGGPRQV